jgi:hypothetical protein
VYFVLSKYVVPGKRLAAVITLAAGFVSGLASVVAPGPRDVAGLRRARGRRRSSSRRKSATPGPSSSCSCRSDAGNFNGERWHFKCARLCDKCLLKKIFNNVFISVNFRAKDIEEFFSSVGKIRDVRLILCNKTRRFKGIAYVEFKDIESVALVRNQAAYLSEVGAK